MNESGYIDRLHQLIIGMTEDEQRSLLEELEDRQSKKKRKHSRKECLLTANYTIKGRAFQNFIQDISIEGLFIETRESFSAGDEIFMTISYSNDQRPFKITGEVVRISANGVGVKFKKLSQVQEEIIKLIIAQTSSPKK